MARETKVGLLAGLAFIICFAVILSNRGDRDPYSVSIPGYTTEARNADRPATGLTALPVQGAAPRPALPYPATAVSILGDAGGDVPARGGSTRDPGASEVASREVTHNGTNWPPAGGAGGPGADGGPAATHVHSTAAVPTPNPAGSLPASLPAKPASDGPHRTYTVTHGDTLSKIAATQYGNKSGGMVKAILDANKDVLKEADVLPVGVRLNLPAAPPAAAGARSASINPPVKSPARTAERQKPAAGRGGEPIWYQVKRGDRYYNIAREQLGDGSRWQEIHDLNKDKWPDPGLIREGVRIKLPQLATSKAGSERRP
jgi:nucleoid-associated protein YgaU